MPKTITRRGQESRQRILTAARPLFHRHGVSGTSVDQILERAKMGKSQFYHYFTTKEELVMAVVDEHLKEIVEFLAPHTDRLESLDDLDRWFEAYSELARHHDLLGCPIGVIAAEVDPATVPVRRQVIAALKLWVANFTTALSRMQAGGVFNQEFVPQEAAEFIGCTLQGVLLVGRVYKSTVPLANAARQIRRYLETFQP